MYILMSSSYSNLTNTEKILFSSFTILLVNHHTITSVRMYYFSLIQFAGFGHIFRLRNQQNTLKNRDLLEIMKKMVKEDQQIMSCLNDFDMCHHCKQLLPKTVLKGCRYRSSKVSVASMDSDNLLL
jgi:hypothetical protein